MSFILTKIFLLTKKIHALKCIYYVHYVRLCKENQTNARKRKPKWKNI